MTFEIEIMLRENHHVFTETLTHDGNEPRRWTDADVRAVMTSILAAVRQVKDGAEDQRSTVALRGVSWIVSPHKNGVVIAVDIPSGQAVAGPFDIDDETLNAILARVMTPAAEGSSVH